MTLNSTILQKNKVFRWECVLVSPAGSICRGDERLLSHSALQWPHCPEQERENIVKDYQIVQNDDDLYVS